MADLNEALFTGIVPKFENVVVVKNEGDENHAYARMKLNVSRGKNKEGKYVDDLLTFAAFGKTAQYIAKFVKPGSGLIVRASVRQSVERKDAQGNNVLDAQGRKIYTGEQLVAKSVNFVRGGEKSDGSSNGGNAQQAQVAPANVMAQFQQQVPAQQPQVAAPAGGYDFGTFAFK